MSGNSSGIDDNNAPANLDQISTYSIFGYHHGQLLWEPGEDPPWQRARRWNDESDGGEEEDDAHENGHRDDYDDEDDSGYSDCSEGGYGYVSGPSDDEDGYGEFEEDDEGYYSWDEEEEDEDIWSEWCVGCCPGGWRGGTQEEFDEFFGWTYNGEIQQEGDGEEGYCYE